MTTGLGLRAFELPPLKGANKHAKLRFPFEVKLLF